MALRELKGSQCFRWNEEVEMLINPTPDVSDVILKEPHVLSPIVRPLAKVT